MNFEKIDPLKEVQKAQIEIDARVRSMTYREFAEKHGQQIAEVLDIPPQMLRCDINRATAER